MKYYHDLKETTLQFQKEKIFHFMGVIQNWVRWFMNLKRSLVVSKRSKEEEDNKEMLINAFFDLLLLNYLIWMQ